MAHATRGGYPSHCSLQPTRLVRDSAHTQARQANNPINQVTGLLDQLNILQSPTKSQTKQDDR